MLLTAARRQKHILVYRSPHLIHVGGGSGSVSAGTRFTKLNGLVSEQGRVCKC